MEKNNVKETAYSTKVYPAMMGDYASLPEPDMSYQCQTVKENSTAMLGNPVIDG